MTDPQLREFIAKNWPGLELSSDFAPRAIRLDGLEWHQWVAQLDWTRGGTRLKLIHAYPRGPWVTATKSNVATAINGALDAMIAHHEGTVARLKAAKSGKQAEALAGMVRA